MFKKMKKENRCLIVTSIFLGLVFLILLIVGLATKNNYGLVLGWSVGFVVTIVSMFLLFKSGELIQNNATGKGKGSTGLVILFYASRFILYATGLVLCGFLDYKAHIPVFRYSIFTCLCALLPSHLFIAILYHDNDDAPVKATTTNVVNENKQEEKKEEINK